MFEISISQSSHSVDEIKEIFDKYNVRLVTSYGTKLAVWFSDIGEAEMKLTEPPFDPAIVLEKLLSNSVSAEADTFEYIIPLAADFARRKLEQL